VLLEMERHNIALREWPDADAPPPAVLQMLDERSPNNSPTRPVHKILAELRHKASTLCIN